MIINKPKNKTWLLHFYYNKTMANFCKRYYNYIIYVSLSLQLWTSLIS